MMLEIKDLVKNYRDFRLECSLQVKPGQITGLIGGERFRKEYDL